MSIKTVYLSGNITGNSEALKEKFDRRGKELIAKDFTVVFTPLAIVNLKLEISQPHEELDTPAKQMKARIKYLLSCDELHLLPCWNECKSAQLERDIALRIGMPIEYYQ